MSTAEDYAIVLDFLPNGHPGQERRLPIAQVIGKKYFVLLEVVPRVNIFLKSGEEVYLGSDKRDKVHHIAGRISANQLTPTARMQIEEIIDKLISAREKEFIDFFNKAGPITTRMHQLELLPGIGKRHMWKILEEREKEPFKSFEDIKKRISLVPDPRHSIVKRIVEELEGNDRYRLFTS